MDGLASRYAAALLSIAIDEAGVTRYKQAIIDFDALLDQDPAINDFMISSFIPIEEKELLIDKIIDKDMQSFNNFLKLLCAKKRFLYFHRIKKEFVRMANAHLKIKEGIIYSSSPLDDSQIRAIEQKLGASIKCDVELKNEIDKTVLGGFKIIIQGRIYDYSLSHRLARLGEQMLERGDDYAH